MTNAVKLGFGPLSAPAKGSLVVFCDDGLKFGPATRKLIGAAADLVQRAAKSERFTGKAGSSLDLIHPEGLKVARLLVAGIGKRSELKDFVRLGGAVMGKLPKAASEATFVAELPDGPLDAQQAADLAQGARLRAYTFDRYKTRRTNDDAKGDKRSLTVAVADVAAARRAYGAREAVIDGVLMARDLVNEPANVLYPAEFARRTGVLKKAGVAVEVFDVKAMEKLGMNALLGVGQGSAHGSRMVVMRWNGGKKGEAPVAFIGKGVCFDTGGISIKPAASMEDMKGDMAGAACVVGLMQALAARKARVNAVGLVGLVENMPDGNAQRPGDIVKSMSGQTIEIINTDAEGRLVLADVVWYAAQRFKPKFMIDLATLTGAIIVALGQEYAGMFANNDELSARLTTAGEETGEKVWRMPLAAEYDKMIDSKFADVKNTGGSRWGGAITAAQFIKRFVDDKIPWAHLDIAGTGFDSRQNDVNRSWGSGWGVRLLDRLVADHYER
ncbi:MAG TPA: leucyl aminopeptidase [Pseudolabrys sp.]|jgi:leucyl aminopeptidase|uniref:leucyl aminopeptidase n=1 Tax=Pseudolabrys sp. TaxID=1960880 RepID=UPI002DDDA1EA|nr:leucyl aminopeptidase [Pseudolabrys sp.]HEV2628859.1 leucyl aminopeptidase [Pseudolabrys sp.]